MASGRQPVVAPEVLEEGKEEAYEEEEEISYYEEEDGGEDADADADVNFSPPATSKMQKFDSNVMDKGKHAGRVQEGEGVDKMQGLD